MRWPVLSCARACCNTLNGHNQLAWQALAALGTRSYLVTSTSDPEQLEPQPAVQP
jgi:hypothetical protein